VSESQRLCDVQSNAKSQPPLHLQRVVMQQLVQRPQSAYFVSLEQLSTSTTKQNQKEQNLNYTMAGGLSTTPIAGTMLECDKEAAAHVSRREPEIATTLHFVF
jgi:hypothetical protein